MGKKMEKARAVRRQPPLIQITEGSGRTPLTLKTIGEYRRINDEQVHTKSYRRLLLLRHYYEDKAQMRRARS